MDRGFKFHAGRESRHTFSGHLKGSPAARIPHAAGLAVRNAKSSKT